MKNQGIIYVPYGAHEKHTNWRKKPAVSPPALVFLFELVFFPLCVFFSVAAAAAAAAIVITAATAAAAVTVAATAATGAGTGLFGN